jgi:hypothetical protein
MVPWLVVVHTRMQLQNLHAVLVRTWDAGNVLTYEVKRLGHKETQRAAELNAVVFLHVLSHSSEVKCLGHK